VSSRPPTQTSKAHSSPLRPKAPRRINETQGGSTNYDRRALLNPNAAGRRGAEHVGP